MARTNHGGKDPSFEHWSRRPFNRCGQLPGKFSKRRTHKAERAAEPDVIAAELAEAADISHMLCPFCGHYHDPKEHNTCTYEDDRGRELLEWEAYHR